MTDPGPITRYRMSEGARAVLWANDIGASIEVCEKMLSRGNTHYVRLGNFGFERWKEMHCWCKTNTPTYGYAGHHFFFPTDREAVMFKTLWG